MVQVETSNMVDEMNVSLSQMWVEISGSAMFLMINIVINTNDIEPNMLTWFLSLGCWVLLKKVDMLAVPPTMSSKNKKVKGIHSYMLVFAVFM
mgnify:CR=1 FL=1